ncbi:MAG: hypothetical protein JRI45_06345 [Deltaproteobacteria bacterium]|nr:hypothetical protein [Deltaproteobacteria bacterium]MBW2069226.1 hypothetical protein [Deltaproteobacteria bacterium]
MKRLVRSSLMEYFRDALEKASQELNVQVSEWTQFYVADMLTRFAEMKKVRAENPLFRDKTFAEVYLESQMKGFEERAHALQAIGDAALFLTGFFGDSFKRKVVDIDYYGRMGQLAYATLVQLIAYGLIHWGIERVFDELSERFWEVKDLLAQISESGGFYRNSDVLRIYERWLKTHSRRDARKLKDAGIVPIDYDSKKFLQ